MNGARLCLKDQPQHPEFMNALKILKALRLVLCTQPRSKR